MQSVVGVEEMSTVQLPELQEFQLFADHAKFLYVSMLELQFRRFQYPGSMDYHSAPYR